MEILLFRATLAPCLVLLVSLAARRAGPRWGGRLLGAPTTTGPFLLLLCTSSGTATAAGAARGSVAGQLAVAGFCLTYGRLAARLRPAATLAASLACAAAAGAVAAGCANSLSAAVIGFAVIGFGLATWPPATTPGPTTPHDPGPAPAPAPSPRWEIPSRMALSAVMVLAAVTAARAAGPFVGGAISALPVLLAVMGPCLHRSCGSAAASSLMRGALTSGAGTIGFVLVLHETLVPLGILAAFALALSALALIDRAAGRYASAFASAASA